MAKYISTLAKNRHQIILGLFLGFNLLVSTVSRGGIILLANVAYGLSMLAILMLVIWDFFVAENEQSGWERILGLIFFGLLILSFFFSLDKGYGLSEFLLFGCGTITFLYLSSTEKLKESHIENLLKLIISAICIIVLGGVYIYLNYPLDRFASFFYNFDDKYIGYPNALADLLLIGLPIVAYFISQKKKYYLSGAILMIIALYLTYSRGAYLTIVAELIAAIALFYNTVRKKSAIVLAIKAILTVLIIAGVSIFVINNLRDNHYPLVDVAEKITLNSDEKAGSVNERLEFYKGSIQIIKDHPWTGVGSDGFQFVYPRYQQVAFTTSDHPHNLFLKIAVENGLPASIALAVLFLFILVKSARSRSTLVKVLGISIFGLLIHNQIDYNLNFVPNIMLLFLISGIVVNQEKRTTVALPTVKIFISILSILLIYISAHEGYFNYHFQLGRKALEEKNYQIAEKELTIAQKLIFPRRLHSALGETYLKEAKLNDSIENYQRAIEINSMDAHAYNALGEVFYQIGLTEFAAGNFKIAAEYNGQNFLRFHYNLLLTTGAIDTAKQDVYLRKLQDFVSMLANNEHNIILTDNPEYAIKIAALLYEKTHNEEFKKLQTQLEELLKHEKEKFQQKFNFNFATLGQN